MKNKQELVHSEGEKNLSAAPEEFHPLEVDTYAGKIEVDWDPNAAVTPLGQLPFFIQYLKVGCRFEPLVSDCPLQYSSNNAPKKVDVLGSLLLSILSGHHRYAHISTLMNESVNTQLLGMNKVVSDDSARRALKRIDEQEGIVWLEKHLQLCYEPLLKTPWILDVDVTIKPLYGHQEGAVVGYNPKKPGRPSHTYHSYLIGQLRLVLNVIVQPGDQSHCSNSLPGLLELLDRLPEDSQLEFIRGDCDWGNNTVMSQLEEKDYRYLFKLKKSKRVKQLIHQHHGRGEWIYFNEVWEAKESHVQLLGWSQARRVIIVRKRLGSSDNESAIKALECRFGHQQQLAFIDGPEDIRLYEYAVLVTNLDDDDIITLIQHYRDRADSENVFDEIKNQWGWGGYTTKDLKSSQFMSRMIALVYNWWTLFVRLANPDKHHEMITSRPLLLSSVAKLTQSGRQKKLTVTSQHTQSHKVKFIFKKITDFLNALKRDAPQLNSQQIWTIILVKALEKYQVVTELIPGKLLPIG